MSRKRLLILVFAPGVLALLAAACGGGGKSGLPTGPTGASATPSSTPSPPAATTAPGGDAAAPTTTVTCGAGQSDSAASKIATIQRTGQRSFKSAPARVIDPAKTYYAFLTTSRGDVVLQLAAKDAPATVNNFVFLSCEGYYDGLTFHRYEPDFVIQGGDPAGNGSGGPGYTIPDEISPNWRHDTGALAMAKSNQPNSAGSQFYITLTPQPSLNGRYTVFGKVTAGLDVVRTLRAGDTIIRIDIQERSSGS